MAFNLTSTAFSDGEAVPRRFTCEGDDLSPPLAWSGTPDGTKSFALLCEDPDAPRGTWHHWAVYNIPATQSALAEGYSASSDGAREAINDFGRPGYGGPCPPPGHGLHHYHFRLLALGVERLELDSQARCLQAEAAARPHVLAEARLTGTYAR